MVIETINSHRDEARRLRNDGSFEQAGEYYTVTAYLSMGRQAPDKYGPVVRGGLLYLLRAAICYRLGGRSDRCENRCRQGEMIAKEQADRAFEAEPPNNSYDRAKRAVWYEFIGDFRIIGEYGDPAGAYDRAVATYQDAGDPDTIYSEQEHIGLMMLFRSIGTELGRSPGDIDSDNDWTLSDWVEYKRARLPSMIDGLVKNGTWQSTTDRG